MKQREAGGRPIGTVLWLARPEGLEPPAYWFEASRSIQLSYGRVDTIIQAMSTGGLRQETEIKLRVPSAATARRLLAQHGFQLVRRRVFESNTIFDTPAGDLYRQGCLLRVRTAGRVATLTYKGPSNPGRHKSRPELDFEIANAEGMAWVLERLGFHPVFRYEKYRAEYANRSRHALVTIDETPIGVFMELEGAPGWIDRTARALGFSETDYITASYASLYFADCATRGFAASHMVFTGKHRSASTKVPSP
jgi:adenylate cyclase, class 2